MTNTYTGPNGASSLSIIVMVFNELHTLENVVRELDAVASTCTRDHELLVIDDGSTDGSREIAERLAKEMPSVQAICLPENQGIGEVLKTGFAAARGDFVTISPADGQFPPEIVSQFYPLMESADLVLGYLGSHKSSAMAHFLAFSERMLYRILFGAIPRFQGIYMFRRSMLDDVHLTSQGRGWTIQMELIVRAKRNGYRINSVPTAVRTREAGESKVRNLRNIKSMLTQVAQLWWNIRIREK